MNDDPFQNCRLGKYQEPEDRVFLRATVTGKKWAWATFERRGSQWRCFQCFDVLGEIRTMKPKAAKVFLEKNGWQVDLVDRLAPATIKELVE